MTKRFAASLICASVLAVASPSFADESQDIHTRTIQSQAEQNRTLPDQGSETPATGAAAGSNGISKPATPDQSAQAPEGSDHSSDSSVKTGTLGNTSKTLSGRGNATGSAGSVPEK